MLYNEIPLNLALVGSWLFKSWGDNAKPGKISRGEPHFQFNDIPPFLKYFFHLLSYYLLF